MKIAFRCALALVVVACSAWVAISLTSAQDEKPYEFVRGDDVTEAFRVEGYTLKPRFRGVDKDLFRYDVYLNVDRRLGASAANESLGGSARTENWMSRVDIALGEDELEGRPDLLAAFRYNSIHFTLHDGHSAFSGYIGPAKGADTANFYEVLRDGERSRVNNIPGWPGVTASNLERSRSGQSGVNASAWFSVSPEGRISNECYYADFNRGEQRNYPGRLLDPVQIALAIQPEFAADAEIKVGESVTVRRRFPMGPVSGQAVEYDFTYTLERVYGKADDPSAALLTFTATPVQWEQTDVVNGLSVRYTAPAIEGGRLMLDMAKGVAASVEWKYSLQGEMSEPDSLYAAGFEVDVDFSASLVSGEETEE